MGMHYYYDDNNMRRGLFLLFNLLTSGSYIDCYTVQKIFMKEKMITNNMFYLCLLKLKKIK